MALKEKSKALRVKHKALKSLKQPCYQDEINNLKTDISSVDNAITAEKPPAQRLIILTESKRSKHAAYDHCQRRHEDLQEN